MKNQTKIRVRLQEFKSLSEEQQFQEFMFCLLTPQSNAQRCWQAVEEISKLKNPTKEQITNILKTKTRFHNTKAERILNAKSSFEKIQPFLVHPNTLELRDQIAKNVNGYGLKEASHFLRNIGKSENKIAILDRHILKNLHALNLISDTKINSPNRYFEVEQIYLDYAKKIKIPADELDLLWWSQENGEVFK